MTGMYFISFRILGFPRRKDNISIQEGIAQDCSRKMGRAKTKGKEKKKKFLMTTSYRNQKLLHPFRAVWSRTDCEQSLIFFRFSEGSAHARERRAAKPRVSRNVGGSPRRKKRVSLFSYLSCLAPSVNLRGHLRVSRVLLDGPRKKRDCSQSRSRTVS